MSNKIHVSLIFTNALLSLGCCVRHVKIYLEQDVDNTIKCYLIDPDPRDKNPNKAAWILSPKESKKQRKEIKEIADEVIEFEIDGNIDEIASTYVSQPSFDMWFNNCADFAAWFLDRYANIPNPGPCGRPASCNQIFCCFFAPSYLQPCTTPGRVADYTRSALQERRRLVTDIPSSTTMIRDPLLTCT